MHADKPAKGQGKDTAPLTPAEAESLLPPDGGAVAAESSPSLPATTPKDKDNDKGGDKGPSCPTCGVPMERYVGPNPHKQGTWRCPVHLVRHRLDQ